MAYQHKDMTGSLFKNDRKESEKHPDYNGTIIIDGVAYWLSGWIKRTDKGSFLSLAAKPKDGGKGAGKPTPQQQSRARPSSAEMRDNMNDEIPF